MRWIPVLSLLAFTPGIVAAPIPKEVKVASDAQRILGTWQSEFLSTNGGEKQPDVSMRFLFEADGKCAILYRAGDNPDPDSEFALDTGTSPRRMKWLNGRLKTEWRCLYELDDDTLTVAFIKAGTEIPAKLEPSPNTTIYYLKRIKE